MNSTTILGIASDPGYATREVDTVSIPWGDARKHRQLLTTATGRDVALALPRGTFLSEGDVVADDGTTIVVVTRPPEDAVVVDFADNTGTDAVRRALILGYVLGNQHAPLDVSVDRMRTPLMTGPETAEQMLRDLHLVGRVDRVPLAARGWTNTSADHHHSHDHAHAHAHAHYHSHGHGHGHAH
ncbi:urease accessory protein UreE [Dietzia aurantiaca]|uniref:Urease accessory protein UreE n=1 Tax=Dietzia aurantiaca TaxID=983873 RepID=A0ABV9PQI3_9ACTN